MNRKTKRIPYFVSEENDPLTYKVDAAKVPLSAYLGVCGMPGRTAYFGLKTQGKPQAGETLVVSAASGAVGSAVGQIGKKLGLHVVGVAGGPDKCAYVKDELGFDQVVDYKAGNLDADLAAGLQAVLPLPQLDHPLLVAVGEDERLTVDEAKDRRREVGRDGHLA